MLKEVKKICQYNFKNILCFEFFFKILTVLIFSPLFLWIFHFIMNVTGYSYLTKENFLEFLLNPITIILLILLFFFLTIYSLFDIGVLIGLIDSSSTKKKVHLKEVMKYSLKKSMKVFSIHNFPFIFFILFFIPFLNMGIGINLISSIKIPEFILDYIFADSFLSILYIVVVFILILLFFRWIYCLHYYFLEDSTFLEAISKSKILGKKRHFKDFLTIIFTEGILSILYFLLIFIEIIIMVIIYYFFQKVSFLNSIFLTIMWLSILISFVIYSIFSSTFSYMILSVLFYRHKNLNKEKINHLSFQKVDKKDKKKSYVSFLFIVFIVVLFSIFTNMILKGKLNLNIEYVRTMEVTAHRGASVIYPENTMSAFVGAKELGSDWIELDVQQTKDGKIIILHDTNFKRTAGVDLNTWEATIEDVQKLDVGSFKDSKFKGEKVPLLRDVIKWAKENNMKLNIELKPTGREKDFEKNVSDIIEEYQYSDQCVITSQVYEVLENFKKVNPHITTVYVTALAYGDVTKLDAADYFSVEASSIKKSIVSLCHNEGKQIYAWTVNTDESIQKMIDMNVDNIITDNPTLAKKMIYSSKSSNLITEILELINRVFS